MSPIKADDLISLKGGDRRICVVTEAGSLPRMTKEGEVEEPYQVGDALMADKAGNVIVPPVDGDALERIAVRIIEGDQRAGTDSRNLLALAMAVVLFRRQPPEPEPPASEPQSAALAVPAGEGLESHG